MAARMNRAILSAIPKTSILRQSARHARAAAPCSSVFTSGITTSASSSPLRSKTNLSTFSPELPDTDKIPKDGVRPIPKEFDIEGRVYGVTGGAQGVTLEMVKAMVELGSKVTVLDYKETPSAEFFAIQALAAQYGGMLDYMQMDVRDPVAIERCFQAIGDKHGRFDGSVLGAAVQHIEDAITYPADKMTEMLEINVRGVVLCARETAKQCKRFNMPGSIVTIASMSAFNANKGLRSIIYNASKAAVNGAMRVGAMEFAKDHIRWNSINPGNIVTPMVLENLKHEPHLKELWEQGNMMGRLSMPHEYRSAVIFLLSDGSSFMTASTLVIDGGYTAW